MGGRKCRFGKTASHSTGPRPREVRSAEGVSVSRWLRRLRPWSLVGMRSTSSRRVRRGGSRRGSVRGR